MAVVTIKSSQVTSRDAVPPIASNDFLSKGEIYEATGLCAIGATDNAASKYVFCSIPSGARITEVTIYSDAILGAATAPTLDLQATTVNGSATVKSGFFGSPVLSSAVQTGTDVTHTTSGANTNLVSGAEKRVWENLGLAADPFLMYDVVLTSTVNNATTGANVRLSVKYTV